MKTEFEYISFVQYGDTGKTTKWRVINKSGQYIIGRIHWFPGWRQYVFTPHENTIYSAGCLKDIQWFIENLMNARKKEVK